MVWKIGASGDLELLKASGPSTSLEMNNIYFYARFTLFFFTTNICHKIYKQVINIQTVGVLTSKCLGSFESFKKGFESVNLNAQKQCQENEEFLLRSALNFIFNRQNN